MKSLDLEKVKKWSHEDVKKWLNKNLLERYSQIANSEIGACIIAIVEQIIANYNFYSRICCIYKMLTNLEFQFLFQLDISIYNGRNSKNIGTNF